MADSVPSDPQQFRTTSWRRILVAVWGIPLLTIVILIGGWWFAVTVALIAAFAMYEYMTLMRANGAAVVRTSAVTAAALVVLLTYVKPSYGFDFGLAAAIYLALVSLRGDVRTMSLRLTAALGGLIYIAGFLSLLVILRSQVLPHDRFGGATFILFLMSSIWICDTGAYYGGVACGHRPLAPAISPKKTVEGAIIGLLAALVWGLLGVLLLRTQLPWLFILLTAVAAGTVGQAGDLIESMFKRSAGVKDSGSFLPEHGGIFDRFDSLILTTPVVFLLAHIFRIIEI